VIRGLKLDTPSPDPAVWGGPLFISWMPQSGDPSEIDINLACDAIPGIEIVSPIQTNATKFNVTLPGSIFNGQNFSTQ
ncbi:hypothetical protein C0993_010287, partial [Termitomyces sp. T159_Od127]